MPRGGGTAGLRGRPALAMVPPTICTIWLRNWVDGRAVLLTGMLGAPWGSPWLGNGGPGELCWAQNGEEVRAGSEQCVCAGPRAPSPTVMVAVARGLCGPPGCRWTLLRSWGACGASGNACEGGVSIRLSSFVN